MLDLKRMMQSLRTGIGYSACPLPELLQRQEEFPICREAACKDGFSEDPEKALAEAGKQVFALRKDYELYRGFVQGLGVSGLESQLEHIGLYDSLLDAHLEEAQRDCREKTRLYVSLGLFAGITLCVLLL